MSDYPTVVAFRPSNAEYVEDGYMWTLYNNGLENPYTVENTDEKLDRVKGRVDPEDYEREEHEHWIRLDFDSVVNGEPKRLHISKDS